MAIRIFELGFKLFSEEVEYVVRYLQFLLSINDDTSALPLSPEYHGTLMRIRRSRIVRALHPQNSR